MTWIKLYRSILDWEWYDDSKMVHLFIHLLVKANHKNGEWRGIKIKRGQLLTGIFSLCQQTKISPQSVRTCLKKLKSTNEITIESTNNYSIITLCNYENYQDKKSKNNDPTNKPLTNGQQTGNKPTNYKQEYTARILKNEKNEREVVTPARALIFNDLFKYMKAAVKQGKFFGREYAAWKHAFAKLQKKYAHKDADQAAFEKEDLALWMYHIGNPINKEIEKMWNHYEKQDFKLPGGMQIKNWRATMASWMDKADRFTKK